MNAHRRHIQSLFAASLATLVMTAAPVVSADGESKGQLDYEDPRTVFEAAFGDPEGKRATAGGNTRSDGLARVLRRLSKHERIAFEVAENGRRFVFDEAPIDENGFPLYGNPFITQGFIYPPGTLVDEDGDGVFNGVIIETDSESGLEVIKPEFPDKVIGLWICEGKVFAQEGFNIETGPTVISTQLYDFKELSGDHGKLSFLTTGLELIDVDKGIRRAITGGTGPLRKAGGQVTQTFVGVNESEGFVLKFEVDLSVAAR
jgi:hypothetical protein